MCWRLEAIRRMDVAIRGRLGGAQPASQLVASLISKICNSPGLTASAS